MCLQYLLPRTTAGLMNKDFSHGRVDGTWARYKQVALTQIVDEFK